MMTKCWILLFLTLVTPSRQINSRDSWLSPEVLSLISGTDTRYANFLLNENKNCIEDIRRTSPDAVSRFTELQLAILCRNRQKWTSQSLESGGVWSDPGSSLTKRQRMFLQHFSTCSDLAACICTNNSCEQQPADSLDTSRLFQSPESRIDETSTFQINRQRAGRRKRDAPTAFGKAVRKEYRRLSEEERNRFHAALNRLKAETVDGLSKYDLLVLYHTPLQAPGAHWGPAFLPWHRELLKQLELALRTYDHTVALPYWDSTLDEGLPRPGDSILWTDEFVGTGVRGVVDDGPFKRWRTYHAFANEQRIVRDVGGSPFGALYRPSDLDAIMAKSNFNNLTNCVDPFFELLHGTVHLWVGGHMLDIPISPNDPVFFLHHAFVDWIWETFRQRRQLGKFQREHDYPTPFQSCTSLHYANASMAPFPLRNLDGLSSTYTDIFYTYENRPTCDHTSGNTCSSPYLACDRQRRRCLSKVKVGGNCTGFENAEEELCYKSNCIEGRCVPLQEPENKNGREFGQVSSPSLESTTGSIGEALSSTTTDRQPEPPFTAETITIPGPVPDAALTCEPCNCASPSTIRTMPTDTGKSNEKIDLVQGEGTTSPTLEEKTDGYVWFTITVLKGKSGDPAKEAAKEARVIIRGLNYNGTYEGNVSSRSEYPYYLGVSLVKVPDPLLQPEFRTVTQIAVYTDASNESPRRLRKCKVHCRYSNSPCSGRVTFDVSSNGSESLNSVIPYSAIPQSVLLKQWRDGKRETDYFLFLCDENSDPLVRDEILPNQLLSTGCYFQRFENFLLVGYAEYVVNNASLRECKTRCHHGGPEGAEPELICRSIMYWEKDALCVVTSQSRLTKPALFAYFPQEEVVYFDYVCNIEEMFER